MRRSLILSIVVAALTYLAFAGDSSAQERARATHTIYMSLVEVKGGTTADKLGPPTLNPKDISKGYDFKAPGAADKNNPQRWEVATYMFNPAHVTVQQGDAIALTVFVVNGDKHEVWINGPDGRPIVARTTWNRGREYQLRFVAEKAGAYQLVCSDHAPSMQATFFSLPR